MPEPAYRVVYRDEGPPQIVHCASGADIPTDVSFQSYCDFLGWVSQQPKRPEGYDELDGSHFFADVNQLVDYFKQFGHMLFVERGIDGIGSVPRKNAQNKQLTPGGRMYRLFQATEWPGDSAQTTPSGIAPGPLDVWIAECMFDKLNRCLKSETSGVRCISCWPVRRCFVYIDISDFSKYEPGRQALVVNSLTSITGNERNWQSSSFEKQALGDLEAQLCIGDGYILSFTRTDLAVYYAARLATKIESLVAQRKVPVEFHFRIGIHAGEVYRFWDRGRDDWNYVGDGINGGNRVLAAIGKDADDLVFLSHEVRAELIAHQSTHQPYSELLSAMLNRGRRSDKHGRMWRVYELSHTRIER